MVLHDVIRRKKITFRGREDDFIICDFEWQPPKRVKAMVNGKIKQTTWHPVAKKAKIKLDITNPNLLEKVNMLTNGDIVYMDYEIKKGNYDEDVTSWKIIDFLDDIDLEIIRSQIGLIKLEPPKKDKLIQPKKARKKRSKNMSEEEEKDEIEELEELVSQLDMKNVSLSAENRRLKSEIDVLKKQLQDKQ